MRVVKEPVSHTRTCIPVLGLWPYILHIHVHKRAGLTRVCSQLPIENTHNTEHIAHLVPNLYCVYTCMNDYHHKTEDKVGKKLCVVYTHNACMQKKQATSVKIHLEHVLSSTHRSTLIEALLSSTLGMPCDNTYTCHFLHVYIDTKKNV